MTFDVEPDAPEEMDIEAENLHEYLVNRRGYDTEDVLAAAHDDGTLTLRIAPHIGSGELLRTRLNRTMEELREHRKNIDQHEDGPNRESHLIGIDDGLQAIEKALGEFDE
jgi:hypothetical protein